MSARPDWNGRWPRLIPEHFGHWFLHRLAIYAAAALTVALVFLLVAGRLRGYSFPLWALGAGCVVYFASGDRPFARHHR